MTHRIGLLIDTLIGGGAERITLNFAEQFSQLGHDVHIFLVENQVQHIVDNNKFKIHAISEDGVLSNNKFINKLALSKKLKGKVKEIEQKDNKEFLFFISSSEDMDRLSKMAGLKNTIIRYRNSIIAFLEHKIGNKTGLKKIQRSIRWKSKFNSTYGNRHLVTVSKALINEFSTLGITPKTVINIYNPFDFDRIRERGAEPADLPQEPYIIYAAKLENRKRQDVLLKAYAKSGIQQKLVLLGGTYTKSDENWKRQMQRLAEELNISDRVIFAGFHTNPYPWVKNAELFAMSSDNEGLPTVLIESLILGTKVVSTDCPTGPSEILTGDLARFLSPVEDHDALAKNMTAALSEYPEITEELISKYNSKTVAEKYISHAQTLFG